MKLTLKLMIGLGLIYAGLLIVPGYGPVADIAFYENADLSIIAHRGGRGLVPGNTIEAAINAVDIGSDIIELDVHLTADAFLVVRHDTEIDTTTNGSGLIVNMDLVDIQSHKVGYHKIDYPNKIEPKVLRVPTLKALFQRLPNQRYLIELKPQNVASADALCETILTHDLQDQVVVGSFHSAVLRYFRKTCPSVPTSLGESEITWLVFLERLHLGHLFKSPGYSIQLPFNYAGVNIVRPSLIELAHDLNLAVDVWTVNDSETMRVLIDLGVDGIITDRPDRLGSIVSLTQKRK
ncbi:glycerophosphodiester phosphodiesterase [Gammaproteobacteria bacterium]|nr:glycerophosphodiester phosphodiesterase [Gammaproteobacteria bacterium]